ncbi:MAG: AraC family transcriptional regulator [Nonomuraea sp.]|nr:AraC family transcriptional regulator [Nonomuraea sp.]
MKKNGHTWADVRVVPYRPGAGVPPGVEVMDLPGLVERARGHEVDLRAPRRLGFHELVAVRAGSVRCSVDFDEHEVGAGSWLWVRPGQVSQYRGDLAAGAEATVVLFPSGFLSGTSVAATGVDRRVHELPLTPTGSRKEAVDGVLRLLEAKRLLVHTGLPPAAIGDRVGFPHATAFGAFFRHRTGMTPATFRTIARGTAGVE